MIGAIALMALLLIAGSGGGGGGGAGAGSASPNNNNGWKDIDEAPDKEQRINKQKTTEYNNSPFLTAIKADRAYAELELNGLAQGGDNVRVAIAYGNNEDTNVDRFIAFSGIDPNNAQIAGNLDNPHYKTSDLKSSRKTLTLDSLKTATTKPSGGPTFNTYYSGNNSKQLPGDNLTLNSANIIDSSKGNELKTGTTALNTQGIAYNSKISEILYSFYEENGTRTVNSQNILVETPFPIFRFDFENIKIASQAGIKIYEHLNSHEINTANSNEINFTDTASTTFNSSSIFNSTMSSASNTLMIAPTGIKNEGEGKEDFLSYVSKNANSVNNLIFGVPLKSNGIEIESYNSTVNYRSCAESNIQYCIGVDNQSESYKYLQSGIEGYNGDKFSDGSAVNLQLAQSAVSGAAAILAGAWPQLKASDIRDILFESADKTTYDGKKTTTIGGKTYDDNYGNGILNLFAAVHAMGPRKLASTSSPAGFASDYVIDNTALASSPIFGDSITNNVSPQLSDAVYFDKYNRNYKAFLGNNFSTNNQTNSFNLNNFAFNNVENKSTSLAFGDNQQGQLRFSLSQFKDKNAKNNFGLKYATIDRSIDPQGNLSNNNGFSFSYQPSSLSKKLKVGFAFNTDELANSEAKEFGTSGFLAQGSSFNSNPYQSFFTSTSNTNLTNNSLSNPLLMNSRKFNQAFAKHDLVNNKVALKFSYQSSFDNAGQNHALNGKQQNQALNFGLDLKANDSNNIAITVGELKEMDRNMLNSKGSGAFENTGNSRTSFVKVATSQNIVDHLNLTSTIAEGLTKVNGNDRGIFRSYENIHSRSMSFALQYDGITKNKFGIAYSQPMRVYKGKVNYDIAVGMDENQNIIRRQGSASLAPNGKQQDYEFFYQHDLSKNSQLRLNLMMQKELNNFKSAPTNYVGYLSYGANF